MELKLVVLLSLVLAVGSLCLPARAVDDDPHASEREVETSAKRVQSIFWSDRAVTVITREDILRSGAFNLVDLLRRVPGLDVYHMKPYYPVVGARGRSDATNSRVLLLVDGREELIELGGFPLWGALTLDPDEIQRIEVIRGPASTLYGANAVTAVVSITTVRRTPAAGLQMLVAGGELGHERLYLDLADVWKLGAGDLSLRAHAGIEGKRSFSDARDQPVAPQLGGHLRYRLPGVLDSSLQFGASGGEGLISLDLGDMAFQDAFIWWVMGDTRIVLGRDADLLARIYFTRARSDFRYRSDIWSQGIWIGRLADMFWSTNTADGKVELRLGEDRLRLLTGAHFRYNLLDCRDLIVSDQDSLGAAGYLQLEWRAHQKLRITAGARLHLDPDVNPITSQQVAAVFRPWRWQSFHLGYSSAFRKPSDFESRMHFKMGEYNPAMPEAVSLLATGLGNPRLGNESAHAFEAGWRSAFPRAGLEIALDAFLALHRNTIRLQVEIPQRMGMPDLSRSEILYDNRGPRVNVLGAELALEWRLLPGIKAWGNLALKRAYRLDEGEPMAGEPVLRINLGGGYHPVRGLFVDCALHHVSAYRSILVDPLDPLQGRESHRLGDRFLMIANLGYRLGLSRTGFLDVGLAVRQPLAAPGREIAGVSPPQSVQVLDVSDFGGEILTRLLWVYLRWVVQGMERGERATS